MGVTGRFIFGVHTATIVPIDEMTDPCEDVTCHNGGVCSNGDCTCVTGYEGQLCETVTNNCASNPCQNGGACVNAVARYDCTCTTGYEGTHCETLILWCDRHGIDCNNNGECSNTADRSTWQCACNDGYSGTECAEQLCMDGVYCQNLGSCGYRLFVSYP